MSLTLLACSSPAFTYFVSFIHPITPKEAVVKMCCITTDEDEYSKETKQQLCWNVFQIHRSAANGLLTNFHLAKKHWPPSFGSPNAAQEPEIIESKCH